MAILGVLWHKKYLSDVLFCGMLGLLGLMTFITAGGQIDGHYLINSALVTGGKFST